MPTRLVHIVYGTPPPGDTAVDVQLTGAVTTKPATNTTTPTIGGQKRAGLRTSGETAARTAASKRSGNVRPKVARVRRKASPTATPQKRRPDRDLSICSNLSPSRSSPPMVRPDAAADRR